MFVHPKQYDVIVVGAGHAGVEAALASARMGCSTLMLTHNADTIGQMSCNPAIGGSAKGHLVREIDAMGGEMGRTADMTGIQFRMLNRSKGPAVWSPRAQCDKKAYQFRLKWVCERQAGLDVMQHQVSGLTIERGAVVGVESSLGVRFLSKTVVITTGTFLKGLLHFGDSKQTGGRCGDATSLGLSDSLRSLGLDLGRFKTGTPPRILRKSIDYDKMERQDGDYPPPFFSHWWNTAHPDESSRLSVTDLPSISSQRKPSEFAHPFSPKPLDEVFHVEQSRALGVPGCSLIRRIGGQLPCYLTTTTSRTREIVLSNLHLSAMYSGRIEGVGPRYCPSIEDKFVRFSERELHQVFVEPEGCETDELYLNGCSSSLPYQIQMAMVQSIVGCERAEILRPAYAVEYDYVLPTQLQRWLETKVCRNLFLGGQINGTSGYEEAAAQGFVAGVNAARRSLGLSEFTLDRNEAYIGVLIDDLVTRGTSEPYRMFTSRVEHRLLLRQDNADLRLSSKGHELGLISNHLYSNVLHKLTSFEREKTRLQSERIDGVALWNLLRRPEVSYSQLPNRDESLSEAVTQQLEIMAKYEGYIERQELDVARSSSMEGKEIPPSLNFREITSLRREAGEKFDRIRPTTVGQASRISGITPSDIAVLLTWMKRRSASPIGNAQSKA